MQERLWNGGKNETWDAEVIFYMLPAESGIQQGEGIKRKGGAWLTMLKHIAILARSWEIKLDIGNFD